MNYLKYITGKALAIYRYRNKKDPFEIFSKMKSEDVMPDLNGKTALVLPIRVSPVSNLFEGLMGYTLRLRGYDVYSLLEGGNLKYSENNTIHKNRFLTNALSYFEQIRFYKIFGLKPLFFDNLIQISELNKIKKECEKMEFSELLSFSYKKIPVGKHAKYALMRYLMVETLDKGYKPLLLEFLLTSIKTVLATEEAIKKTNPAFALLSHGCYATWGSALDVLTQKNIKTSVWGRGYVGNGSLVIGNGCSYLYERVIDPTDKWEGRKLTVEQTEAISNYFKSKRAPKNTVDWVGYYNQIEQNDGVELENLKKKCARYKLNVGVYPNIPWDGTMYSSSDAFPTVRYFVKAFLEYMISNPDVHFVLRAHPAEIAGERNNAGESFSDILKDELNGDYENLSYLAPDSPLTSYAVSELTKVALIFGSTLSLEFVVAGHPVIQVGKTNTSNKGLVIEPKSKNELYSYLNSFKNGEMDDYAVDTIRALNYAHYWVYEKHIEDPFVNLEYLNFSSYKFASLQEMKPGKNSKIDSLIEVIES